MENPCPGKLGPSLPAIFFTDPHSTLLLGLGIEESSWCHRSHWFSQGKHIPSCLYIRFSGYSKDCRSFRRAIISFIMTTILYFHSHFSRGRPGIQVSDNLSPFTYRCIDKEQLAISPPNIIPHLCMHLYILHIHSFGFRGCKSPVDDTLPPTPLTSVYFSFFLLMYNQHQSCI